MNNRAFNVLEYNKIVELLKENAGSDMTKKVISELQPYEDVFDMETALDETSEATELITHKGAMPLGNFYDIERSLSLAKKGGSLSMGELLKIRYNLSTAMNAERYVRGDLPDLPIITSICDVLAVYQNLEDDIERCIISEDEMSDNASSELKRIRRSLVNQNEALKSRINSIINSSKNAKILQDAIVTVRDGRYVVPVKAEHRSSVPGIVHDKSASGATLFIEPQSVVELNNQLRQLEIDEQNEIARILEELSARVAEHYDGLKNNQKLLVQLDFINAKGRFALSMDASRPIISKEGKMDLKEARHPLIPAEDVVPINVGIGKDYKALIITGPNTGGKTVTLKLCGLLTMMAMSGMHIPAEEGSVVPLCREIFADIGDEQSIEQSLSTFSSHMKNIVEIVNGADSDTLVLMDELGAGTDPTEGAALAISVIESLLERGSTVMATTHYAELKKYAITRDGVQNASMQFDIDTLSPTYKLIVGMPGKSNAFEISSKLGLRDDIIANARNLLEGGDLKFEDVLTAIESDRKAAEAERDQAVLLNIELKKLREKMALDKRKSEEKSKQLISDAKRQAREIIRDARAVSKEVRQELREISKSESMGERNRKFDESRKKIKKAEKRYEETFIKEANDHPVNIKDLKVGDRVKIVTIDQTGDVLSLPDKKGEVSVQVGMMKVKAKPQDLMVVPDGVTKRKKPRERWGSAKKVKPGYKTMSESKAKNIKKSLDVHGQNLADALEMVDKYIDDAYLAKVETVTIVHGKGAGILKEGIRKALGDNKYVKSFRPGNYNEGDEGVTIVKIK